MLVNNAWKNTRWSWDNFIYISLIRNSGKINLFYKYLLYSPYQCMCHELFKWPTNNFVFTLSHHIDNGQCCMRAKNLLINFLSNKRMITFHILSKNLAPPSNSWWGKISIDLSATIIRALFLSCKVIESCPTECYYLHGVCHLLKFQPLFSRQLSWGALTW